jgi:hypothetical protein
VFKKISAISGVTKELFSSKMAILIHLPRIANLSLWLKMKIPGCKKKQTDLVQIISPQDPW